MCFVIFLICHRRIAFISLLMICFQRPVFFFSGMFALLFCSVPLFTLHAQQEEQMQAAQLNRRGLEYYHKGNFLTAYHNFKSAFERVSDNPEYPNNAGMALLQLGRVDEARDFFLKAIDLNDSVAIYHLNLGLAILQAGRLDEAAGAFQAAIERDRLFFDAHAQLGLVYFRQGKLEEAEQSLRVAAGLADSHEIENYLGAVYLEMNRLDDALNRFRRAVHFEPDFFLAHYNIGLVKQRQQDFAGAEKSYQEAVRLNPTYAPALYNLGLVQARQNKVAAAINSFQLFIERAPAAMESQKTDARNRIEALRSNSQ